MSHGLILQQEIRSKHDEKRNNDVVVRVHEVLQNDERIPGVQVQNCFSISFRQPFAGFPQEQGYACMHQEVQAVEKEQRPPEIPTSYQREPTCEKRKKETIRYEDIEQGLANER